MLDAKTINLARRYDEFLYAPPEEYESIHHHPEEFFTDDSYTCKICGYNTDSEEDFVEHILDAHETKARSSNAVSIGGEGRGEYWDVDSMSLAEEFSAN